MYLCTCTKVYCTCNYLPSVNFIPQTKTKRKTTDYRKDYRKTNRKTPRTSLIFSSATGSSGSEGPKCGLNAKTKYKHTNEGIRNR